MPITGLLSVGPRAMFLHPKWRTGCTLGSREQARAWLTFGAGHLTASVLRVAGNEALQRTRGWNSQMSEQKAEEPSESSSCSSRKIRSLWTGGMKWFHCLLNGSLCGCRSCCIWVQSQTAESGRQKVAGRDANGLYGISCVAAEQCD